MYRDTARYLQLPASPGDEQCNGCLCEASIEALSPAHDPVEERNAISSHKGPLYPGEVCPASNRLTSSSGFYEIGLLCAPVSPVRQERKAGSKTTAMRVVLVTTSNTVSHLPSCFWSFSLLCPPLRLSFPPPPVFLKPFLLPFSFYPFLFPFLFLRIALPFLVSVETLGSRGYRTVKTITV